MREPFKLTWRHQLEIYCAGWNSGFFRTRAEIREAVRRKIYEIEVREGRKEGIRIAERRSEERFRELLKSDGVIIPPDVAERIFGDESGKDKRGISLSRFARWFRKTTK